MLLTRDRDRDRNLLIIKYTHIHKHARTHAEDDDDIDTHANAAYTKRVAPNARLHDTQSSAFGRRARFIYYYYTSPFHMWKRRSHVCTITRVPTSCRVRDLQPDVKNLNDLFSNLQID